MNINDSFPSKTLKASDLKDNHVAVTIDRVEIEKMGSDLKPVVYFQGKDKGLVLNKTNSKRITEIAGSAETEDWTGLSIILYPTETEYQGETVDCIRIKKPQPNGRPAQKQAPQPEPSTDPEGYPEHDRFVATDEDVPF